MKAEHCVDQLDINNLWDSRASYGEVNHSKENDTTFVAFLFLFF